MAKDIEARAVISAIDKTGNTFAKVAGKFKEISAAAKAFEKNPFTKLGLGENLAKQLSGIKLHRGELDGIMKEYRRFDDILKSSGVGAHKYLTAHKQFASEITAQMRALRGEYQKADAAQERFVRRSRMAPTARFVGTAVGVGSAAYVANRGIRSGVKAGSEYMREGARDYLAGLTDADSAKLKNAAMGLSAQYPSVDATTMHERLRDTAMSMRSVDTAIGFGDVIARGMVVLQSLKGKDQALEESRKFFKALDTLGKNVDPKQVSNIFGGFVKAVGVEGADLNMGDLFQVSKLAKSAGPGLSDAFLYSVVPGLVGDMGASRLGTALGSTLSQVVGGRATKESKAEQARYGLRDKKGNFLDRYEMMQNPFDYAMNHMLPKLQAKGVNVDDNVAVASVMSKLFSNQTVADIFTKMITQRAQYAAKSDQYAKAPGLESAQQLPGRDPFVAWEGLLAQMRNFAATVADPVFPKATAALNYFSSAIASAAKAFSEADGAQKIGYGALGTIAGGAGLYAGAKVFSGIMGWMTGAAALSGSAAALNGSAVALTAAAARLGAGSVMDTVSKTGKWAGIGAGLLGASRLLFSPVGLGVMAGAGFVGGMAYLGSGPDRYPRRGSRDYTLMNRGGFIQENDATYLPQSGMRPWRQWAMNPDQPGTVTDAKTIKAELEGSANLNVDVKVEASGDFWPKVDQRIDNRIKTIRINGGTPASGTGGSTGKSMPEASGSP